MLSNTLPASDLVFRLGPLAGTLSNLNKRALLFLFIYLFIFELMLYLFDEHAVTSVTYLFNTQ